GIRLDAGEARAQPGAGRDVDDAAIARVAHRPGCRLGEPERAVDIGLEDRVPVRLPDLFDRPADLSAHAAGGVDQDVDAPLGRHDLLSDGVRGVAIGNVQLVHGHAARLGEAACAVAVNVGDMDACTTFGESECDHLADALCSTGYERCAASEG